MTERYVINPVTKRSLLVGGKTYFNLVNQGVLPYDPTVRHPRELYHIRPEDTVEKIDRLKQELKTPEYFAVQGKGPRLSNKLMIKKKSAPYERMCKPEGYAPRKNTTSFVVNETNEAYGGGAQAYAKLHGATSEDESSDESDDSDSSDSNESVDWESEFRSTNIKL